MDGTSHEALHDYLRVVWRRRFIVLICAIGVPVLAVYAALRQEPLYKGSAEVVLQFENIWGSLSGINQPDFYYYFDPTRFARTQVKFAQEAALAKRVLNSLKLKDRTPQAFLAASSVTADPNADLLVFSVKDTDRALAQRLATAYGVQYTRYRQEVDTAALRRALRNIEKRIEELQQKGDRRSLIYARSLVDKAEQLRTLQELQTSIARLLNPSGGAAKIRPQPVRYGFLGFGLGLVFGLGLAFLAEALDRRIRHADEISERLDLPLLARIPEPPRRLQRRNELVMLAAPDGAHAEAYRVLRTSLEFVNLERHARSIMVTSALEQEGKSTTVANLAVALARMGRRVVLVDLDLRRPRLTTLFNLQGQPGLTDVILGHATLEQAIARVPIAESADIDAAETNGSGNISSILEVVPAGPAPPNPGEFVGAYAVRAMLAQLASRADFLLIDAPPLLHFGDALTLAGATDALILVTRLKLVTRPILIELRRVLDTCPAPALGFVLGDANIEEGYGYGSYRYGATKQQDRELVG